MPDVAGKVKTCGVKLTEWSKKSFGSVRKMLEEKQKLLSKAELDAAKGGDLLLVSILIDKAQRCWIEEAVDNNFLAHEAKLIKAIPLSLNEADDKLCWSNNVNGLYSVKAGYNLLVNDELSSNAGASSSSLAKSSWKALWKLKTPNRIKTLLWSVVFQHTRKLGNKVAHRLARAACNFSSSLCTWIEDVSICSYADYSAEIINAT
nr:hypothetical protein CFP56_45717 [Quercus suber]